MKPYGVLELTAASPAQSFIEPLTLTQVKTFLRITEASPADEDENAMLNAFITAARETAEIHQGRDLIEKQYDLVLDYWPEEEISLRDPLQSVERIQYIDSNGNITVLTEGVDYDIDTKRGIVRPVYGITWPSFSPLPSSAVLIRFTSGFSPSSMFWSDAGARVLVGMRMLIEQWYDERLPIVTGSQPYELPFAVRALFDYGGRLGVQ
jgi:uncharacterized phiE125 gp8 family phage protein